MNQPHIFHEFDNAMVTLKDNVLLMAGLTRQILEHAMGSLLTADFDLARMVIGDDSEVDDWEVRIDELGMDILARFHPVGHDLRMVVTSMKTVHNLERISDHAVGIAKRTKKICRSPEFLEVAIIEPLYTMAEKLLRDSLLAYTDCNTALGERLKYCDRELDSAHKKVIALLSGRIEKAGPRTENLLHLIFIARALERIGDLAVNIGQDAVYLAEARDIRHERRKNHSSIKTPE